MHKQEYVRSHALQHEEEWIDCLRPHHDPVVGQLLSLWSPLECQYPKADYSARLYLVTLDLARESLYLLVALVLVLARYGLLLLKR